MALSASVLSAAIKAARLANNPTAQVLNNTQLQNDCDAIAAAVVAHITSAAVLVVPGTGLVAPGGGGPVTGAATGMVT